MFPYRVKYTESEYDIQNNGLLYKIDQICQNTSEILEKEKRTFQKSIVFKKTRFQNDQRFIAIFMARHWRA